MDLVCVASQCFCSTVGEHGLYLTVLFSSIDCDTGDVGEKGELGPFKSTADMGE